jgi:uncharacterized protein YutE (UPF0331/DUF86 family)
MTLADAGELEVIELVLPRLQAEGYDVYVHPSPSILPPFMQSYRPDAIALKQGKKIAIEIIHPTHSKDVKVRHLKSLFAGQSEWELQVFYASPLAGPGSVGVATRADIKASLRQVEDLSSAGHRLPALLMAWATFEAIGRALLPAELARPQTPARLVEVLASEGIVTPDEAIVLRRASSIRNSVAHGGIDSVVDDDLLARVIAILTTLTEMPLAEA